MVGSVLVPVDDSAPARAALSFALAEHPDADLTAFHAVDPVRVATECARTAGDRPSGYWESALEIADDHAREVLGWAEEMAEGETDVDTRAAIGPPADAILDRVDDVDHVVIGSHGRTGARRVVLGSVAERVVRRSPVPVTVVHGE